MSHRFFLASSYPFAKPLRTHLSICIFLYSESLTQAVLQQLGRDRYQTATPTTKEAFFTLIDQEKQRLDCLIFQDGPELPSLANWLHGQATLLPAVIVRSLDGFHPGEGSTPIAASESPPVSVASSSPEPGFTYHTAEVIIPASQLTEISKHIDVAIAQFINLSPTCRLNGAVSEIDLNQDLTTQNFLMLQQRRLTEKLKERLGYLGVYYKRNPQNFFRHLPPDQRRELLEQLKHKYRDIVLHYFVNDGTLNQRIDDFVNTVFFTDIAVSQVVEIHMELMDEFAKQLKLEGRSEEILLDYRLTLIDTIAHLCEMYRRSIPRES